MRNPLIGDFHISRRAFHISTLFGSSTYTALYPFPYSHTISRVYINIFIFQRITVKSVIIYARTQFVLIRRYWFDEWSINELSVSMLPLSLCKIHSAYIHTYICMYYTYTYVECKGEVTTWTIWRYDIIFK